MKKRTLIPVCILALALLLCACAHPETPAPTPTPTPEPTPTPDPFEGLVPVPDGADGIMLVPEYEDVPVMQLDPDDFVPDGNYITYTGSAVEALRGIDVSEFQKEIDWAAVKADGVEFAMIRTGYRGFTEGMLIEDEYFRQNIEGALANGLRVGVYFFSQAISAEEARDEARFVLDAIAGYDVTMPVAFDWENIGYHSARTDDVDNVTVTDCAIAFGDVIREAGYAPAVYFYRELGYLHYELDRLTDLEFWAGTPGTVPDFYYAHTVWQYSFTGRVSGIHGDCDLDLYFIRPEAGEPPETEAITD